MIIDKFYKEELGVVVNYAKVCDLVCSSKLREWYFSSFGQLDVSLDKVLATAATDEKTDLMEQLMRLVPDEFREAMRVGSIAHGKSLYSLGSLYVVGDVKVDGDLVVHGDLNVEGDVRVNGRLVVSGDLDVNSYCHASGDIEVKGKAAAGCLVAVGHCIEVEHAITATVVEAGRIYAGGKLTASCVVAGKAGLFIAGAIEVRGRIESASTVHTMKSLMCEGELSVQHTVSAESVDAGSINALCVYGKHHIKSKQAIVCRGYIHSLGEITCGERYGIFAGLDIDTALMPRLGYIRTPVKPERIKWGVWQEKEP